MHWRWQKQVARIISSIHCLIMAFRFAAFLQHFLPSLIDVCFLLYVHGAMRRGTLSILWLPFVELRVISLEIQYKDNKWKERLSIRFDISTWLSLQISLLRMRIVERVKMKFYHGSILLKLTEQNTRSWRRDETKHQSHFNHCIHNFSLLSDRCFSLSLCLFLYVVFPSVCVSLTVFLSFFLWLVRSFSVSFNFHDSRWSVSPKRIYVTYANLSFIGWLWKLAKFQIK